MNPETINRPLRNASSLACGAAIGQQARQPAPVSRLQEALENLSAAINGLAVAESNLTTRLEGVMRPTNPPSGDSSSVGASECTMASPLVDQVNAIRQRVHNLESSIHDTLSRLEV
jgi:hypothetical protein